MSWRQSLAVTENRIQIVLRRFAPQFFCHYLMDIFLPLPYGWKIIPLSNYCFHFALDFGGGQWGRGGGGVGGGGSIKPMTWELQQVALLATVGG